MMGVINEGLHGKMYLELGADEFKDIVKDVIGDKPILQRKD